MSLFGTGKQIGQAVKNVQRLKQILAVFAGYGFSDTIVRANLGKFLPKRLAAYAEAESHKTQAEKLRFAFEALGPTFVKLGQLLSTRSDLLSDSFIEQFTLLQDHVQLLPFDTVRALVEAELEQKLEEAYASFRSEPLAAGSIAQVHEAQLKTGECVVVKVQRPEIKKIIETDISLLQFLAHLLEKYIPETRVFNPSLLVENFARTLSYELDFVVEANNTLKMRENLMSFQEIVIPQVYQNFSTHRVLTLDKLEGVRFDDMEAILAQGIHRKQIVEIGAKAFFKTVMIDGLFHGDLHGGNLFILPGNRIGMIDFGIVGRLSEKSRDLLASIVMSLIMEDYENLCYQYMELAGAKTSVDFEGFQREVRNTLSPYMGASLANVNVGSVLIQATQVANRFDIQVPGDWMLVFKAIFTMEGIGRRLDPSFDPLALGEELVKDLVKRRYCVQRIGQHFTWMAQDMVELMKVLPRQLRWMFKKLNSNDFALEIKSADFQALREECRLHGKRISLGTLVAGLSIASSIAFGQAQDTRMGMFFLVAGCFFLFLYLVQWIK
jgi:ubiquinone biosynthesis protein